MPADEVEGGLLGQAPDEGAIARPSEGSLVLDALRLEGDPHDARLGVRVGLGPGRAGHGDGDVGVEEPSRPRRHLRRTRSAHGTLGLEDPATRLAAIAQSLDDALAGEFAPESRPFTPHLTVARFDPPVRLEEDLGEAGIESRPFGVEWLTIYRSHLQRPAPVYEPIATFPLGEGNGIGPA